MTLITNVLVLKSSETVGIKGTVVSAMPVAHEAGEGRSSGKLTKTTTTLPVR